jgi:hypothetical protein
MNPNKYIKFKISHIYIYIYELMSMPKFTLMEFNEHGVKHGGTPKGTFIGILIHHDFHKKCSKFITMETPLEDGWNV